MSNTAAVLWEQTVDLNDTTSFYHEGQEGIRAVSLRLSDNTEAIHTAFTLKRHHLHGAVFQAKHRNLSGFSLSVSAENCSNKDKEPHVCTMVPTIKLTLK